MLILECDKFSHVGKSSVECEQFQFEFSKRIGSGKAMLKNGTLVT